MRGGRASFLARNMPVVPRSRSAWFADAGKPPAPGKYKNHRAVTRVGHDYKAPQRVWVLNRAIPVSWSRQERIVAGEILKFLTKKDPLASKESVVCGVAAELRRERGNPILKKSAMVNRKRIFTPYQLTSGFVGVVFTKLVAARRIRYDSHHSPQKK